MRWRWLGLAALLAVVLVGDGLVAHAFVERHTGGTAIARRVSAAVSSFHVEVTDSPSQGPPSMSADVVMRPHYAASVLYPKSGARELLVNETDQGETTYQEVGQAGQWLAILWNAWNAGGDNRLLWAYPWTEMGQLVGLVGRENLPDGPAWHLHGDEFNWLYLFGDCCDSIDLWVGLDGLPRKALELFPGAHVNGHERPPYPVTYTYSRVNRVAPITAPDPGVVVRHAAAYVSGSCGRWTAHPPRCLRNADISGHTVSAGGMVLGVTRLGMAVEPPLPPPLSDRAYFVLDLRLDNPTPASLVYRLTLDNMYGAMQLAPNGEIGMVAAGSLAPHQSVQGRLVYQLPYSQMASGFPTILAASVEGNDAYALLGWCCSMG